MEIGAYIVDNRDALQKWGVEICDRIVEVHGGLLKVPASARVKDPDSARRKQLKKGYQNPCTQMTDLVGARFVVLTSNDLKPIISTIEGSPLWSCTRTRNPDEELAEKPDTFGYQSHHFELRSLTAPVWCCEVQVRTLLQHTMAELSHDAFYKSTVKAPSQAERLVARSIALMETTDELLCKAMEHVRSAHVPAESIKREALHYASRLGGEGGELIDDLFEAYPELVRVDSIAELKDFLGNAEYEFIFERIAARRSQGIFAFTASALLIYWISYILGEDALTRWPYMGSIADLKLVLSDIGYSV